MKRYAKWGLGIFAVIVVAVIGYLLFQKFSTSANLAQPERGRAVRAVYATGVIEPVRWSRITSLIKGRIKEVHVEEQQAVKEGDLLITLNATEEEAQLEELEARAAYLKKEVARLRPLQKQGYTSREKFDRTESEYEQVQAAIRAARDRIEDLRITAPIDGVVLREDAEPGEIADSADALIWVGDPSALRVNTEVDEEDIPLVEAGQTALVKADAFPNRAIEGEVSSITPKGDPVNKIYRVYVSLPEDHPLKIGMTTEVNIIIREKPDALLIPASALVNSHVWVVENKRARKRSVKTGVQTENKIEVLDGLAEEDTIVVRPPKDIREGALVLEE